jgi:hypothetical protein
MTPERSTPEECARAPVPGDVWRKHKGICQIRIGRVSTHGIVLYRQRGHGSTLFAMTGPEFDTWTAGASLVKRGDK